MTGLPIIDFAGFAADDPAGKREVARALRGALESCGFFYLRNHGLQKSQIDAVFEQSQRFFASPQGVKNTVRPERAGSSRGYEGIGLQALDEGQPGDLKEIYHCGPERAGARPTLWPVGMDSFKSVLLSYQKSAGECCQRLLRAIALSLTLPEDYFAEFFEGADSTLRLLHYPPVVAAPLLGQLRAGAHTDFGGISMLVQDESGGLEVQVRDGSWVAAPPIPDTAMVNTGDLLERWTNGLFRSSPHRVVPFGDAPPNDRYSVVLFYSPHRDTVISCLEPCQSADNPAKYPPVTAGEHVRARAQGSRRATY
ncbi:MAG: isopenicillin N synthase family oxygenase [Deltaproteobacteria bacterium]|nr:isopenicillin N synthase family oxygenase [Deltaproteobacteria bacterium]